MQRRDEAFENVQKAIDKQHEMDNEIAATEAGIRKEIKALEEEQETFGAVEQKNAQESEFKFSIFCFFLFQFFQCL